MKKVLITGTAGFIGYHLANKLVQMGHEVTGLDVINDYYDIDLKFDRLARAGIARNVIGVNNLVPSTIHQNYSFVRTDLGDRDALFKLFREREFQVVVNLAAQAGVRYSLSHPDVYMSSNLQGFLNILEACRHHPVENLIYASSSSVYGLNTSMPFSVSSNVDHPISLYAASKKSNELMAHTYSHLFGLSTIGLRFFTVYGPWGRPDMALFLFTDAILRGKPIEVFNNGDMERDFTYIDDIVNGISRMIDRPVEPDPDWDPANPDPSSSKAPYRLYNIGNNNPVKLMDFIRAIEAKTGKEAEKIFRPMQPGDVRKTWADVDKLISDYDYRPSTDITTGISNFVDWFTEYYAPRLP